MRKLTRKQVSEINGAIRVGQCFYTDPSTGNTKIGCVRPSYWDSNGNWITPNPGQLCRPCAGEEEF